MKKLAAYQERRLRELERMSDAEFNEVQAQNLRERIEIMEIRLKRLYQEAYELGLEIRKLDMSSRDYYKARNVSAVLDKEIAADEKRLKKYEKELRGLLR
jgi:hypothetical protein